MIRESVLKIFQNECLSYNQIKDILQHVASDIACKVHSVYPKVAPCQKSDLY